MPDCIFCKIINKDIDSDIVYESDRIIGFRDLHPIASTHILFVPKKHYATLNDIPADEFGIYGDLMKAAVEMAHKGGVAESGYRVLTNTNKDAGQVIFHLHVHLIGGRPLGKMA